MYTLYVFLTLYLQYKVSTLLLLLSSTSMQHITTDFNIFLFFFDSNTDFSPVLRSSRIIWLRPCSEHWSQMSSKIFFHTFAGRFTPDAWGDLFRNRTCLTLLDTDVCLALIIVTTNINFKTVVCRFIANLWYMYIYIT